MSVTPKRREIEIRFTNRESKIERPTATLNLILSDLRKFKVKVTHIVKALSRAGFSAVPAVVLVAFLLLGPDIQQDSLALYL